LRVCVPGGFKWIENGIPARTTNRLRGSAARYVINVKGENVSIVIQKIKNFFEWFKLIYWFVTDDRDICDYPDYYNPEED
jgi:hypothetical protein